jgi:DNA repair protein RadC
LGGHVKHCLLGSQAPSKSLGHSILCAVSLKALPIECRPREKLLARGAGALSDAELLALLLRSGLPGKNVLTLAQELIEQFNGLAGLLRANLQELRAIRGLGPAKRAELTAVLELARRALAEPLQDRPLFDSPQAVRHFLQLQIGARPHEVFAVLFLDSQHRLIVLEEMFRGTLSQTSVYPREVVSRALTLGAAAVVFAHNHPSGSTQASRADTALTQTLRNALALVDVRVLDHFVVTAHQTLSMAEAGLI